MPRYHFNVHDGVDVPDVEGHELPGIAEARREALIYASGLLLEVSDQFWAGQEWRLDVTDEAGLTLFSLFFVSVASAAVSGSRAS